MTYSEPPPPHNFKKLGYIRIKTTLAVHYDDDTIIITGKNSEQAKNMLATIANSKHIILC